LLIFLVKAETLHKWRDKSGQVSFTDFLNTNKSRERRVSILGSIGPGARKADNLTAISEPIV
jgi:hypothetical protein